MFYGGGKTYVLYISYENIDIEWAQLNKKKSAPELAEMFEPIMYNV